jgi:threonine dehydrogenase-like Zn-dependent dehydrogenase
MRAVTVIPEKPASLALTEVPEPVVSDGEVLVYVVAVGVCGTDVEIIGGEYGRGPHDVKVVLQITGV